MCRYITFGLVIACVIYIDCINAQSLEIKTSNGKIIGKTYTTVVNKKVDGWESIPYAKPPLGELRFRHPKPVESWDGVLDVTKSPNSCMQTPNLDEFIEERKEWETQTPMSEDCLYLSIFAPKSRSKKFWMHIQ